jgi:DNA-binding NtrC family response regulator
MSKARIWAADDPRYFREVLEARLSEAGYDVQTVSSAEEALYVLEHEAFDIVFLDFVTPETDAVETGGLKQRTCGRVELF